MNSIIETFVGDKNIALIGVSMDKSKFGNALMSELMKKGYTVYPVHPTIGEVNGVRCYPDIRMLPAHVSNLILVVKPAVTEQIVGQLKGSSIKRVWMHKGAGSGSDSPSAIENCREAGIEEVHGFCPLMFYSGSGIHGFHLWLKKKFGTMPAGFIR